MRYRQNCILTAIFATFFLLCQSVGNTGDNTAFMRLSSTWGYHPLGYQVDMDWDISRYDELLREVGNREGHDWRLLSAIAYNESRFQADVISDRGARGLMQIMPAVARSYNVSEQHIMDPHTNVTLAAKVLTCIKQSLRMGGASEEDRLKIMLACYNGGVGHVLDARKLASKYGGDPNSWEDVSAYLRLKSDPGFAQDEVVKCGRFNGSGQTLAFVDKVMVKYKAYCQKAGL